MTSLIRICTVTLLALAFTLPAYAGEGGDGGGRRGPGKGKGKHARIGKIFKRFDKNKDGSLTEDEVPAKAWTRLSKCDANGDNAVTKAEVAKHRREQRGKKGGKKGGRRRGGKKDGAGAGS